MSLLFLLSLILSPFDAGLVSCLDASATSTLTKCGSEVSAWYDSCADRTFAQSVPSNRPHLVDVDGEIGIKCDGSNDFLQTTDVLTESSGTIFLVLSYPEQPKGFAMIFGQSRDDTNTDYFYVCDHDRYVTYGPFSYALPRIRSRNSAGENAGWWGDHEMNQGERHVRTIQGGPNPPYTLRIDGQDLSWLQYDSDADWFGGFSATHATLCALYRSSGVGDFANAAIHEIRVYDDTLTDAERNAIEQYLADKWGIQ